MAIVIDERAQAAIARRRAHGRDATLFLRRERDLTISARRLGPFEELVVVGELRVLLEMQAWEQTHPAAGHSPAA